MPLLEQTPETLAAELAVLLLGAAIVGMLARGLGVPYATALVIGGLLVEESHITTVPHLEPGVVLFGFLPPLLFDAAFRLDVREARVLVRPILFLALPGTVATAAIVGAVVVGALKLALAVGLLFGSVVAATDPVAVVGVFKSLHAPRRLAAIAEGESLINDGIAITIYTVVLALALGQPTGPVEVTLVLGREVVGGVVIGAVLGFAFSRLTRPCRRPPDRDATLGGPGLRQLYHGPVAGSVRTLGVCLSGLDSWQLRSPRWHVRDDSASPG